MMVAVGVLVGTAVAQGRQRFPDVSPDHYAYEAVEWAAAAGVTVGYGDGTFKPEEPLSKWHALVFMERYYDEVLRADSPEGFTRGDMMVLLKAINDGTEAQDEPATEEPATAPVAAGGAHTCAIRANGTIACWGDDSSGQASPPSGAFTAVAAGRDHTCAIRVDGTIACWGDDTYGQASPPEASDFLGLDIDPHFTAVAAGEYHTCAVWADTRAHYSCWGLNDHKQAPRAPGVAFPRFQGTDVAAGAWHSCTIYANKTLYCRGNDTFGQASPPSGTFTAISAGNAHTCAIRVNGTIACWGWNDFGQASPPPGTFTAISAGNAHTCAIRVNGTIACWGHGPYVQVLPEGDFTAVAAGRDHTCAIRVNGTIACWGDDTFGQASPP